ncbi:MAG: hypothetical protein KDB27_11125 [Planctomycetales bacterium]|nr:hypothetical protein [Planctomycetales bacterium]
MSPRYRCFSGFAMLTRAPRRLLILLATISMLMSIVGCGPQDGAPGVHTGSMLRGSSGTATERDPAKLLERIADSDLAPNELREVLLFVLQRYRNCKSYADNAQIRLSFEQDRKRVVNETSVSVRYVRDKKLLLDVTSSDNRIVVRSDGSDLFATIEDGPTQDFDGQICRRPVTAPLTLDDIYSVTEYADPLRYDQLTSILLGLPLHLQHSQLGLVLHDVPASNLVPEQALIQRLANQKIGGELCVCLKVIVPAKQNSADAGEHYTYWIEPQSPAIKRVELPTGRLFASVPKESRPTTPRLTLDLNEAAFDVELADSLFAAPNSKSPTFVRNFVVPPLPLPSDLFGKEIGELEFSTLTDKLERSSHWKGKHAVLVWFDEHNESRRVLQAVEQLFRQSKGNRDRVVFRAISVLDPRTASSRDVRARLNDWQVSFPAARDAAAVGRDKLQISAAPTVVVFGADQKLHLFSEGVNPNIADDVNAVLQSLVQGDDVGTGVLEQFKDEQLEYKRQLAKARIAPPDGIDAGATQIAAKSTPKHLKLSELWTTKLEAPGNIVVEKRNATSSPSLLVVDRLQDIVRLDSKGNEVERVSPDLAVGDAISQLQRFALPDGSVRYAAWSILGRRVYLLDQDLKLTLTYPAKPQDHAGILDVVLDDSDGDGSAELYVVFRDPVGLHSVGEDGSRRWSNRRIPGLVSAIVDPGGLRRLLVCGDSGTVSPLLPSDGAAQKPIAVAGRTIHSLTRSSGQQRPTQILAMSYTLEGRLIAIGLNRSLEEQWSYGLPNGVFQSQIRSPLSAKMFSDRTWQWLMAGPDGSVHIVSDDGTFFDAFNSGVSVTGLNGYRTVDASGGYAVLVVSSADGVTAWRVEK